MPALSSIVVGRVYEAIGRQHDILGPCLGLVIGIPLGPLLPPMRYVGRCEGLGSRRSPFHKNIWVPKSQTTSVASCSSSGTPLYPHSQG